MEKLNLLPKTATPAPVLMVQFSAERLGDYQQIARQLRAEGIGVEVYPEAKKLGQQFKYAEQRGFRVALIAGPDEFAQGVLEGQGPGESAGRDHRGAAQGAPNGGLLVVRPPAAPTTPGT